MESSFISNITLENNNVVYFKELKVKHLKSVYKSLLGDELDHNTIFTNLNFILNDLVINSDYKTLNFIEYFILLLEIRCSSIGNSLTLEPASDTRIEINILKIIEQLRQINVTHLLQTESHLGFFVNFKLPTINEVIEFNNRKESIYTSFIKDIRFGNHFIDFCNTNKIEQEKIFTSLPVKLTTFLIKNIHSIIEYFNTVNLLSYADYLKVWQLYFNFNITNLCTIVKLLFGNHLLALYENIFALCKAGNFTPGYIENCTPGEYLLFVKKLEELNSSKQNQSERIIQTDDNESFDEINPYDSGDLPPITSVAQF